MLNAVFENNNNTQAVNIIMQFLFIVIFRLVFK